MENIVSFLSRVNQVFLWPFSIAMLWHKQNDHPWWTIVHPLRKYRKKGCGAHDWMIHDMIYGYIYMVWYDLIWYCMCPFSRGALDVSEQGAINTTGCVSISAVAWRGNGLLFAMAGFLVDVFWLAIGSDGGIGNASAASVPQSHQQNLVFWHPKIYNNINLFSWDPTYIYI